MPGGKPGDISAIFFSTTATVSSALAPVAGLMAMPAAGLPQKRASVS